MITDRSQCKKLTRAHRERAGKKKTKLYVLEMRGGKL